MSTIVATHSFGARIKEVIDGMPTMAEALKPLFPNIIWEGSYANMESGQVVCLWQAPSVEAIRQLFEQLQMPYDSIFVGEWFSARDMMAGGKELAAGQR